MLLILPSTYEPSGDFLLHPLDKIFFGDLSKDSLHTKMETSLLTAQ